MNEQAHPEDLEDFVAGSMNEEESTRILEHLAHCERCAAQVETLWAALPASALLPGITETPPEDMTGLEESLFRRIHRSDLGGQIIKLGTQGFINLISALLSPLVGRQRTSTREDDP